MSPGRNDPCPCGSGRKYKHCCGMAGDDPVRESGPDLSLPSELREFARNAEVWEADVVPVPARIRNQQGKRTVAALVAAEGVALTSDLLMASGAEVEEVARTLEKALARAARKVGVWPPAVRVRRTEVAKELETLLRQRDCRVEARSRLEALDPLARSLAGHLSGQDGWPLASVPETWAAWGLPLGLVADLFEAYAAYYRAAPWRFLDDVPPLAAEWEDGSGIWTASVMGAALGEFGLAVYSHPADFGDLLGSEEEDEPHKALRGWAVHLSYSHRQDLPRTMVKEVAKAGWEVASVDAYPHILAIHTPGGGLQRDLVRRLSVLLRGVAGLVEKYGAQLRSPEGGSFHWSGSGLTLLTSLAPQDAFPDDRPPLDLQDLVEEIQEAGLEREEDIRAFLAQRVGDHNRTPLEGLGGISPAQAQALIEEGLDGDGLLRIAENLSFEDLASSDYLHNARLFLERLRETGGAKATTAGNLKRAFVGNMLDAMRLPAGYLEDIHRMNKVVNEEDAWLLHVLRVNLEIAGLIKLRKGTFSLTRQGRAMLPPESASLLMAHLFRTFFGRFNLEYGRRMSGSSGLQPVFPLLLWQTAFRAGAWISVAELARRVLPPRRDPESESRGEGWKGEALDFQYQILRPLQWFGLMEEERKPEAVGERYPSQDSILVRKTILFDRFLRFTWD